MASLNRVVEMLLAALRAVRDGVATFIADVGRGLLVVAHNTLALVGLILVSGALFAASREDLRNEAELQFLGWLQARQVARVDFSAEDALGEIVEPNAVSRATAVNPGELDLQQAAVANWLSRRYRVAPEPISRLVQEAWEVGQLSALDPTLILAIMAIESSFNPFAQSPVGAQGLMQVMTKVHDEKYSRFGGNHAAFDPVTNLRVGVLVLKECIARAGGIEAGLKFYVGAANLPDDGGYAAKVLAEQNLLRLVMSGRLVPPTTAQAAPAPAPTLVAQRSPEPYQPVHPVVPLESEPVQGEPSLN